MLGGKLPRNPAKVLDDARCSEGTSRFPHLLRQNLGAPYDRTYYLPADFAEPVWVGYEHGEVPHDDPCGGAHRDPDEEDESTAVAIGSSVALLREIEELEGLVKGAEVTAALSALRAAAEHSVAAEIPMYAFRREAPRPRRGLPR